MNNSFRRKRWGSSLGGWVEVELWEDGDEGFVVEEGLVEVMVVEEEAAEGLEWM